MIAMNDDDRRTATNLAYHLRAATAEMNKARKAHQELINHLARVEDYIAQGQACAAALGLDRAAWSGWEGRTAIADPEPEQ